MKKIVDGKTYNTETATELGVWGNDYGTTDFRWCDETLYRTKKGAYFLFGEGGAMSRYAGRYGDMWGDGEELIPLEEKEAKEWAERKLDADEYIAAFGEPEEA